MNHEEFQKLVERRYNLSNKVLFAKGKEYASTEDRLHNFKRAGEFIRLTPEHTCLALASKHAVSIADAVVEPEFIITQEWIDEKVGDLYNYILLLEGLLNERMRAKAVDFNKRGEDNPYLLSQEIWVKTYGIKEGSMVRVMEDACSYENGWNNTWIKEMDSAVGKTFKVCKDNYDRHGIPLRFEFGTIRHFPYFVLEPVVEPVKKMVPLDFSDDLVGQTMVYTIGKFRGLISAQRHDGVYFGDGELMPYWKLKNYCTRPDGSKFEKEIEA